MPRFTAVRTIATALLLPTLGACAAATPATSTRPSPKDVMWVRGDAGARVVLTGTPVRVVEGALPRRGDTLYAAMPFAVAMPSGAFELRVETHARPGTAPTTVSVEFMTVDATGNAERVEAEGRLLTLQRAEGSDQIVVSGAGRRVMIVHDVATR